MSKAKLSGVRVLERRCYGAKTCFLVTPWEDKHWSPCLPSQESRSWSGHGSTSGHTSLGLEKLQSQAHLRARKAPFPRPSGVDTTTVRLSHEHWNFSNVKGMWLKVSLKEKMTDWKNLAVWVERKTGCRYWSAQMTCSSGSLFCCLTSIVFMCWLVSCCALL